MNCEFDFGSLELIQIGVIGPDKKRYILHEPSEDAVAKYTNARSRGAKFQDGELHCVDGQGDLEYLLVSYCLFEAKPDPEGPVRFPDCDMQFTADGSKPINVNVLKNWPSRVVRPLFEKAKDIGEIDLDSDLASLRKQRDKIQRLIDRIERDSAKNVPSSSKESSD